MERAPPIVGADHPLGLARGLMSSGGHRRVLVARGRDVLGVVTQASVEGACALRPGIDALPVAILVEGPVATVPGRASFAHAVAKLRRARAGLLLVEEHGRLVGALTVEGVGLEAEAAAP